MKLSKEHVAYLKDALANVDTPERRALYIAGKFHNADKCKDVDMRYRWDLVYAAQGLSSWINSVVYCYADDSHIDTALQHIVPSLRAV